MVLQFKPISTRFLTNSLYTPMDNTPLHSKSSVRQRGASVAVHWVKHVGVVQQPDQMRVWPLIDAFPQSTMRFLNLSERRG